jgi:hypothetical protein
MNALKDYVNWKLTHADKTAEAEGYPLTMENCKKNKRMKQLEVYGKSVQDGTPTPEAPVEVVSVGEPTVNLFDKDNTKYEDSTLIVPNGGANTNVNYITTTFLEILKPNQSYTLSYNQMYKLAYTTNRCVAYDSNKNVIGTLWDLNIGNGKHSYSFTTPENLAFIRIGMRKTDEDFQIQEGSTATPYEPYGKYKIPVITRGKNVFCHKTFEVGSATRLEYGYNSDGSDYAVLKGDVNSSTTGQMAASQGWYVPSKANTTMTLRYGQTVTISADITALERHDEKCQEKMRIYLYAKGGVASYAPTTDIWYELGKKQRVSRTITLTKPAYDNLTWYPVFTLNSHTMRIENIMIEINDEATSFEPYVEPITTNVFLNEPLRKIGDYADYIDGKGDKVVRNTFVRVYDGKTETTNPFNKSDNEENWGGNEIHGDKNTDFWYFSLNDTLPILPKYGHSSANDYKQIPMSLQLPVKTGAFNESTNVPEIDKEMIWFCNVARGVKLFLSKDRVGGTRSNLLTYLKANPISVVVATYQPYEEPLNIDLPKLNAKTTIIEVDTSLAPSDAYGKYIKK